MKFSIFRQLTSEEMNHTLLVWLYLPVMSLILAQYLHPLTHPCNLSGFSEPPCRNASSLAQMQNSSELCPMLATLDQIQTHAYGTRAIFHIQSPLPKHIPTEILFVIYLAFRISHIIL